MITQIFVPTAIQTRDPLQRTVHTTINLSGRLPATDVNNSQHRIYSSMNRSTEDTLNSLQRFKGRDSKSLQATVL